MNKLPSFFSSYIHVVIDVIVIVNSEKSEVNAVENYNVF